MRLRSNARAGTVRGWSLLGVALAVAGAGALHGCGVSAAERRPNVLLISIDTLRADHLSCYGYERETSPRIDAELAARGVLFEAAESTSSWTIPAHMSMLTGLPVSAHGLCSWSYWEQPEPVRVPVRGTSIAERLAEAGYRTAGFFTHAYLGESYFFGEGFQTWERRGAAHRRVRAIRRAFDEAKKAGDRDELRRLRAEHERVYDPNAPENADAVDAATAWMEEHVEGSPADPFLLFVHLFDPHDPYRPPEPFDRFVPGGPDDPVDASLNPLDGRPLNVVADMVAKYDGEIAWTDFQVGRLLDRLAELGLENDTLVVLTSDHGEEFYEHGHFEHRRTLYRESVHVPLLMRLPGVLPEGRRVREPASILDIVPTVARLCGLPIPEASGGIDLTDLATGRAGGPDRAIVSELILTPEDGPAHWMVCMRRGDERAVVHRPGASGATIERFDLGRDPRERGAPTPVEWDGVDGRRIRGELDRIRARYRDLRGLAAPRDGTIEAEIGELEVAELAQLGYADFGGEAATDSDALCLDGCVWTAGPGGR